ncbi:ATP-binding protein [Streptomyces sp. NPDC040750]|uniref:ATP-binding protein n=1 Tax=Streptomyces sp. NPDC040750 TaxID=3154491 RepID=UPI003405ED20
MRADGVERWTLPRSGALTYDRGCLACRRGRSGDPWPGTRGERPALLTLESPGATIADARRAAAEYVRVCCPPIDAEAVELVVSELCTNAYRHATGWWRLRAHAHPGRLVLDVDDASATPPRPRRPDNVHGTGGLGILLVDRLTDGRETLRHPAGKTVRVTLRY